MKTRKYSIKPTKKQLAIIKAYWEALKTYEDMFMIKVNHLSDEMSKDARIKGLIFFKTDGCFAGVGNEKRTMKLINSWELSERG